MVPRRSNGGRNMKRSIKAASKKLAAELAKPEPKPRTRILQPTMSKTDLLLACQWPWGKEVPIGPSSPEADFGSAFHEVIAWCLKHPEPKRLLEAIKTRKEFTLAIVRAAQKWKIDPGHLRERVTTAFPVLWQWLREENPYGIDFTKGEMVVEQACAVAVHRYQTKTAAFKTAAFSAPPLGPADVDHVYQDVGDNELPGTSDLIINAGDTCLILDHKTGELPPVDGNGQLASLALVTVFGSPTRRIITAIFHAPREGGPATVYSSEVTRDYLSEHVDRLAYAFDRIGDGSLRPGPHCRYCPALMICPTQTHALVALRRSRQSLTHETVGAAH